MHATACLILLTASTAAPSTTYPWWRTPQLTPREAVVAASGAPDLYVLEPRGWDPPDSVLVPQPWFDATAGTWTVDLILVDRPRSDFDARSVFRVVVDDATGAVVDQGVLEPGNRLVRVGDVRRRVLDHPEVLAALGDAPNAELGVKYICPDGPWTVRVAVDDHVVGTAVIGPQGLIFTHAYEPDVTKLPQRLRPHLSDHQWLLICAAAFVMVMVDPRRLFSVRTLDVLVIAAQVPVGFLLGPLPRVGYPALLATTLYVLARTLRLGTWRRGTAAGAEFSVADERPHGAVGKAALIVIAVLLLALHGSMARSADTSVPGMAGLVGGERFLDTGVMPYGAMKRGYDEYGPLHYLLHGLAAKAWPTGTDWKSFDADVRREVKDDTGARVVSFAFHVLTVIALIGIGCKHARSPRIGWLLAVGYLLLAPNLEYLLHASKRVPAAFVALALWAYPSPILSGLLLGLGTAAYWFPVLLVPLWLSAFRGRARGTFLVTYAVVGAVFLGLVLWGPERVDRRIVTVFEATLHAEEGVMSEWGAYADMEGFWGPVVRRLPWMGGVRVAVTLAFLALCLLLFVWPRDKTPARLAALTAAVIIGTQVWKSNQTGEYIAWYLPLLLVALFAPLAGAVNRASHPTPADQGAKPT